jgi:hypothetical protein
MHGRELRFGLYFVSRISDSSTSIASKVFKEVEEGVSNPGICDEEWELEL